MKLSHTTCAFALSFLFVACSSGGGGGSATIVGLNAGINLSGVYQVSQTVTQASGPGCQPIGSTSTATFRVVHDPVTGEIRIDPGTADELSATLNGTVLVLGRTQGTVTISGTVTFSQAGGSFSGSFTENDSDPQGCDATASVNGTLMTPGLQASVSWSNDADLDLAVSDTAGNTTAGQNSSESAGGGIGSGDARFPCGAGAAIQRSDERVTYPSPAAGGYTATAELFNLCSGTSTTYTIRIVRGTDTPAVQVGMFDTPNQQDMVSFTVN